MCSDKKEKWHTVQSASYVSESELQALLASEPSLIYIDEIREGAGSLVAAVREFPLDIGFIDIVGFTADGEIAIVECKLANNDEIKRKVIGQVLEYGASLWGMGYETLDQKVTRSTGGKNLADLVRDRVDLAVEWDEEAFRANVKAALETGNFILIIVVDEIHEELSRIVRFINDAGRPAFSFAALEMRRYQQGEVEMLVPHVFGATPKPKSNGSSGRTKRKWDEATFFTELQTRNRDWVAPARRILDWAATRGDGSRIWWGEGGRTGSFVPVFSHHGEEHQLFAVYTYGQLEVYFQYYLSHRPFDKEVKRLELLAKLNGIKGVSISEDKITKRPSLALNLFTTPQTLEELLRVFDWVIQEFRSVK